MKFFAESKISENIHETPEGYLICIGVSIARTGEMTYANGETPIEIGEDGHVTITREAEEVFRLETVRSFEGKPVTIYHPEELVTPETWKQVTKGIMQNIRRGKGEQESDLVADLLITEATAIQLVKDGLREVSCGYSADYYQLGIGRGEQKNIIGNHLALVPQGRAGSSYAINDHKGKGSMKTKVGDKIKAIFGKAVEDAIKTGDCDMTDEKGTTDTSAYDELKTMVKDLGSKVDALGKPAAKDATTAPTPSKPAETTAKDEGEPTASAGLEARLKALEEKLAALVESLAGETETETTDEKEKEDADTDDSDEEAEETKDESEEKKDEKGKKETKDSAPGPGDEDDDEDDDDASRAEILAPGIDKARRGNLRMRALKVCYATTDGKAVIEQFTGGKAPDLKNKQFVDAVFVGASEILKVKRVDGFSKSKTFDFKSNLGVPEGAMTPEKINEMNAKHYGVGKQ